VWLQDMAWCQAYAFQNRKHMLDLMVDSVNEVTGALPDLKRSVNIHHNYCQCEPCQYTVCSNNIKTMESETDLCVYLMCGLPLLLYSPGAHHLQHENIT